MGLGIRTEAAVLNEKNVDPELITQTMQRGIELYEKYSDGKLLGNVIDIYTSKPEIKRVKVRKERISKIIGAKIDDKTIVEILKNLTFEVENSTNYLTVTPPSFRASDIQIEEDVIEEIARIYGYHKIPNALPPLSNKKTASMEDNFFYWENRVKDAMKFWGFNEVYTYSMVSEELYEGPADSAVKIANPLSEDHVYMRVTLIPSLLEVIRNNFQESLAVFEIANIYLKRNNALPDEKPHFAAILKKQSKNLFFELKGAMEAVFDDLGIENYSFNKRSEGGAGADVFIENKQVGNIELLEEDIVNFELDFKMLVRNATNKKIYRPIPEYPPIIEDLRIELKKDTEYKKIVDTILNVSPLIVSAELIDEYENKMTFRISYQDKTKNLSNEDVAPIRERLEKTIKEKLHAKIG
jgi:phenylalanyl-tRNA synthetase beta chain